MSINMEKLEMVKKLVLVANLCFAITSSSLAKGPRITLADPIVSGGFVFEASSTMEGCVVKRDLKTQRVCMT